MAKIGTDEEGNTYKFGEPSKEEEEMGDDDAAEWDPDGDIPLSKLE